MSQALQDLLSGKGLDDLYGLFATEDIEVSMIEALTDDDLKEIGLKLGQRKRFRASFAASTPLDQVRPLVPAERRQLTVAFCDLVGSTNLATALDPEDLRQVIASYLDTAVATMKDNGGYLAYTQGDGLMVYFGYPVAQEDDPIRAIRAALATVAAVQALETRAPGQLNVRVGVATGRVVVGDMVGASAVPQDFVVGETPNLAARMQGLAKPGEVVVAGETRQLASGTFEFHNHGTVRIKGFDEPRAVFSVKGESTGKSRFDARAVDGVQPIVGRKSELERLSSQWDAACAGRGQICLIQGPPGIGKSRLVRGIYSMVGGAAIEWQCAPHLTNRALHPMATELHREAGIQRSDSAKVKHSKAAALVARADAFTDADLPHLASLVGAPLEGEAQLDAQARARLTLDMLLRRVTGTVAEGPALVILEDAHWADPTTLEFLDLVAAQIVDLPILLIITFRPEFEPPTTLLTTGELLTLEPLDVDAGIALIRNVGGDRQLPALLARRIIEKTDGVPLFVEELTKAILDSIPEDGPITADTLDRIDIPATLQDSLMSRLDRTGPAKEIAQLGAVIGREFTADMVRAIAQDGADIAAAMQRLEEAGLVHRDGLMGREYYVFNHALVQDTAYESILRSKRREVHYELAREMLAEHPAFGVQEPETIARHCEFGGLNEEAIQHWTAAGQDAVARAANLAAVNYLQSALRLLGAQPEGMDRDGTELGLQMTLAAACMSSFGWGSESVEKAAKRAQELAGVLGDGEALFGATWIRWTYYYLGGDQRKALEVAKTIRQMAEAGPPGIATLAAAHAMGFTHYSRGELREAIEALEWGRAVYDIELDRQMLPVFQLASGNALHTISASTYWILGETEKSEQMRTRALKISAELEHVPNRVHCLHVSSWSLVFNREWKQLREHIVMTRKIAEDESLLLWIPMCDAYLAIADIGQGKVDKGQALLDTGLSGMLALGTKLTMPQFVICAADALLTAGHPDKALERLDAIGRDVHDREELLLWSEFLRIRGAALLQLGRQQEGIADLEAAVNEAQRYEGGPLLRRAKESLAVSSAKSVV